MTSRIIVPSSSAIDYAKRNPLVMIGVNRPKLVDVACKLATDALVLGADSVMTKIVQGWHIVASDFDWISAKTKLDVRSAFQTIQRFPEYRANACRATIATTAYAQNVFTAFRGEIIVIKGDLDSIEPVAAEILQELGNIRVVAFCSSEPLEMNFQDGPTESEK
jgi:hypothetical protein